MLKITWQYIPINTDVAFLRIKQDYIHLKHYKIAFFIHVFTSILVLPAGLTQFSNYLRTRHKKLHRYMGWLYIIIVIGFSAPSGFIMGIYANGGFLSQISFCLLALFWLLYTYKATSTILEKNYQAHQRWMIRSFSLALSAITLRAWKYTLVFLFHLKPMDVYRIAAWAGWILNLIIAEIIIKKYKSYEKEISYKR